ncbi:MAG: GNAT family N-acetyltransferase [Labilithrix sp.]|nr:GNAT family N-acetyltransferase [Labilithrix sp.]MCW5815564.1 GNAT family N-acetyltransferase [Labilithrix sp.]
MLAVPPRSEVRFRPVETKRLQLFPLDATDTRELWSAVESSRTHLEPWLPWVPFNADLDSSGRYAEASAADWDAARATRFSIRDKGSHRFLGVIGLESFAHLHESVELGYWLRVDSWGKGLMTEAGRAVLDWAFGSVNAHRVRVAAATDNHPSLAVIGRLGFRFEGIARQAERVNGRWLDHAVFSLLVTDPRPRA